MARRPAAALLALLPLLGGAAGGPPDKGNGDGEGLAATVEIIEAPLEELRGLSFRHRLETVEVDRPAARRHLEKMLREEYPAAELRAEEAALRYLGLLDGPARLESLFLDMLESQVAGFYDPLTKRLYVVPGPLAGSLATAHEMTHALADQHYDLEALREAARGDDDRELALAALLEGEATMVTRLWALKSAMDPSLPPLVQGNPADLMAESARGLAGVPPFMKATLLFPYIEGSVWAAAVMEQGGGLRALDAFFREPPESTEQILHPEKSRPPRDRPSLIAPSLPGRVLPEGAPIIKEGSMGEFGIRTLLGGSSMEEAERAAAGWDADRYILAGEGDALHLTWISVWDSEAEAAEFAAGLGRWLEGRAGSVGRSHAVERKGSVVAAAEGDAGGGFAAASRVEKVLEALPGGITPR